MSAELRVVLIAAVTTGQAVVVVRCLNGEVAVGDWVVHVAGSPRTSKSVHAEVISIMRFNVELSEEQLIHVGASGPDEYRAFEHEVVDALDAGGTAIVVLKGPIRNLDGGRLVTDST